MKNHDRIDFFRSRIVLQEKLLNLLPHEGNYTTAIKGVGIHRFNSNSIPRPRFYKPMLIMIAQGKKWTKLGNNEYIYGENHCFVSGLNMPLSSCMLDISAESPYLAISLDLDKNLITQLAAELSVFNPHCSPEPCGALIQEISPAMLDGFLRLVELLEDPKPEEVKILEPMIIKELHFRLLSGVFGNQLCRINTFGSQSNHIEKAISWMLDNFREPLSVENLANKSNMATSTFHKYFKEITTISPLQYQKRLRFAEAQRLMLSEKMNVTQAAASVGYESPTQFSREYKRLFGDSPQKDIIKLRKHFNDSSSWVASL
jgi:AraC-like DNA-binding protein